MYVIHTNKSTNAHIYSRVQEENWDLASHQLQNAERLFRDIGNEKAAREAARMHVIAKERAQAKEENEKLKQPTVCVQICMWILNVCVWMSSLKTARKQGKKYM